jgi:predicted amino acid racemase
MFAKSILKPTPIRSTNLVNLRAALEKNKSGHGTNGVSTGNFTSCVYIAFEEVHVLVSL